MTISIFSDAYKKEGNKTTPLHSAIMQGQDAATINTLIKSGARPDTQNEEGLTPLMLAVQYNNVPVIQLLLQYGVRPSSPNDAGLTALHLGVHAPEIMQLLLAQKGLVDPRTQAGRTPLSYAAQAGSVAVVQMLLDAGADVHSCDVHGKTALFYAQRVEVVQQLLAAGVRLSTKDNQGNTVLLQALYNGETEIISCLVQHGAGGDELVAAVEACNLELVQTLLTYGVAPSVQNAKGKSALHVLFAYHAPRRLLSDLPPKPVEQQSALCDLLLARGADVDMQDNVGSTPLMLAIGSKLKDKVAALLQQGARVDIKNHEGKTALHYAMQEHNSTALRLLLKAGADPNVQNKDGQTPLHMAAELKKVGAVKLLIKCGANIYIQDARGNTAYALVQCNRAQELKALLKGNQDCV